MTPEHRDRKKISHGEAKHRRAKIADYHNNFLQPEQRQLLVDQFQANDRLGNIEVQLLPESLKYLTGTDLEKAQTTASLRIERILLLLKCKKITHEKHEEMLSKEFDELQKGKADVYNYLVQIDHGISRAQRIRYSVFPPIRVEKYVTRK